MTISAQIESITPELAVKYLELNFKSNRKLSQTSVGKYVKIMKAGKWNVNCDAIGFDEQGRLINGQHRLTSVVRLGSPVEFLVVRGLAIESAKGQDTGRRRMMHDRITIDGLPITEKACASIRNAMTVYSGSQIGTVALSEQTDDDKVKFQYKKHSEFLEVLENSFPNAGSIISSCALLMYATMEEKLVKKGQDYGFGCSLQQRVLHFVRICLEGASVKQFDSERDSAALAVFNLRQAKRAQRKNWMGIHDWRATAQLARKYMEGKHVKRFSLANDTNKLQQAEQPFAPIQYLPGTNK
jgi:hypothetical protein